MLADGLSLKHAFLPVAMGYQELFEREVPVELRCSSGPDDVAEVS